MPPQTSFFSVIFKKILSDRFLIASLVAIILGFIVIFFIRHNITNQASIIGLHNQEIKSQNNLLQQHFLLKQQAEAAANLRQDLQSSLAGRDDLLQLSHDFAVIAADTNVSVSPSFTSESAGAQDLLGRANITLTIDGNLPNIIRFLEKMENSRFLVRITNFDITEQSAGTFRFLGRGEIVYRNPLSN